MAAQTTNLTAQQPGAASQVGIPATAPQMPQPSAQSRVPTKQAVANAKVEELREKVSETSDEEVPLETKNRRIYYVSMALLIVIVIGVLGALYLRVKLPPSDSQNAGESVQGL